MVVRHGKDQQYGFIRADASSRETDIFFHRSSVVGTESLPNVGQRVRFCVAETEKGLRANTITLE